MKNTTFSPDLVRRVPLLRAAALAGVIALAACSPKLDWREVHGENAPYTALLPAKPSSFSREMDLHGIKMTMHMMAADVDGTSFAIGSAKLPDNAQALAALEGIKDGMLKNIDGQVSSEKSAGASASTTNGSKQTRSYDVEAHGKLQNGQPVVLAARFVASDQWVYQAVIIGNEKLMTRDAIDTFMTAFKTQ
ncbi:hypothetical protein [Undibacterium terreum]|uniref:Transmembrane protein n=1 Tax=Undibacterium terreum TaxID=1224302 RepID=A0A916XRU9_9BURK|nr:hypothetical protein [Undibacterium terreum]GGC93803.1 hypothetical protein GCM10011396_46410 [Undibacterium terreum]